MSGGRTAPAAAPAVDVREELLRRASAGPVVASILVDEAGVVAGVPLAVSEAARLGLSVTAAVDEGARVEPGTEVARLEGSPRQIVMAEEALIGLLAKPSGIATAARRFVARAGGRPRIVSGAWKKMPGVMKEMVRRAVAAGGADPRMVPGPFAYLDKTYLHLLGGIRAALAAVAHLEAHAKVVQVKGRHGGVAWEVREAAEGGADVVFIDTGRVDDVRTARDGLVRMGLRDRVELAFGGGVSLDDVETLRALDVDILDIGRQIVDAPLLDMRLEIAPARGGDRGPGR